MMAINSVTAPALMLAGAFSAALVAANDSIAAVRAPTVEATPPAATSSELVAATEVANTSLPAQASEKPVAKPTAPVTTASSTTAASTTAASTTAASTAAESAVPGTPSNQDELAAFIAGWPAYREQLRRTTLAAGVAPATVEAVFAELKLIPRVVSQDRSQPHKVMRHEEYLLKVINDQRINMAREKFREHAELLQQLEQKYGVEGKFIIALWGVESSFGRVMGKHHIPSALATMAYEGRRREFFQKEFIASLRIIEQGHIASKDMRGSWAGAMGQCQFMPTSFLHFAADGDGDGHNDIWGNTADVLASIANYLHKNGWRRGETWGRQVRLTQELELSAAELREAKALSDWQALGVRRDTGADLPDRKLPAKLLLPDSEWERAYLVYHNYEVLLRWNRSRHFATSVGYLAERIGFPPVTPTTNDALPTSNGGQSEPVTEAP